MKKVKSLIIAAIAVFSTIGINSAQAQDSKVCHVYSQQIVETLPEAIAADKQLRDLDQTYSARYDEMMKELRSKAEQFQSLVKTRSQEENERAQKELQDAEKALQEYAYNSQKSLDQKRQDFLLPLYDKVRKAIQKVARAKGYQYVLDATTGTGLLMADGYDITPDVKKELGIN